MPVMSATRSDLHQRPARVEDQLAVFRDRELGRRTGCCVVCCKAVRSQQDCVHEDGVIIHVRCRGPRPPQS